MWDEQTHELQHPSAAASILDMRTGAVVDKHAIQLVISVQLDQFCRQARHLGTARIRVHLRRPAVRQRKFAPWWQPDVDGIGMQVLYWARGRGKGEQRTMPTLQAPFPTFFHQHPTHNWRREAPPVSLMTIFPQPQHGAHGTCCLGKGPLLFASFLT